jgi:hypothetical protein
MTNYKTHFLASGQLRGRLHTNRALKPLCPNSHIYLSNYGQYFSIFSIKNTKALMLTTVNRFTKISRLLFKTQLAPHKHNGSAVF